MSDSDATFSSKPTPGTVVILLVWFGRALKVQVQSHGVNWGLRRVRIFTQPMRSLG